MPINYIDFAKKIKAKYPDYADIDDKVLAEKVINKYPDYKNQVTFDTPEISTDLTSQIQQQQVELEAEAEKSPGQTMGDRIYNKQPEVVGQEIIDKSTPDVEKGFEPIGITTPTDYIGQQQTGVTREWEAEPLKDKLLGMENVKKVWSALHIPHKLSEQGWGEIGKLIGESKPYQAMLNKLDPKQRQSTWYHFMKVAPEAAGKTIGDFAGGVTTPEFWAAYGAIWYASPVIARGIARVAQKSGNKVFADINKVLWKLDKFQARRL